MALRQTVGRLYMAAMVALVVTAAGVPAAVPPAISEIENAISDVADKIKPCVVSIETTRDDAGTGIPGMPNIPGMPRIPGMPNPRGGGGGVATGSGMLFRATNDAFLVLTNAHVVRGAKDHKVKVKLPNDTVARDGVVLGADRLSDTGVVRIERKNGETLPIVTVGRAKDLRVGTFVLAVGSPFHFDGSVTLGIVSSLDRELEDPGDADTPTPTVNARYTGLIQTDASINPGNSGGPLVNLRGEVVGINFAIYSPGSVGQNIGIGFAIPIEKAMAVVDELIQKGHVSRGYLGVDIVDAAYWVEREGLTIEQVKQNFGTDTGAFVRTVRPDSPAAKGGLQAQDVVVAIDGTAIKNVRELQERVRDAKPGAILQLDVLRDKKTKVTLPITVGELPMDVTGDAPAERTPADRVLIGRDPIGVATDKPTAAELAKAGKEYGVKVTAVEPDSLAAEKELAVGSIITEGRRGDDTERVKFTDVASYKAFIEKAARDRVFVTLWISLLGEDGKYADQGMVFRFAARTPRLPR